MANIVTTLFSDSAKTNALYPRTKASAVSDNDGNTLGNVAVCNYAVTENNVSPINVGIVLDLLWTNSSANANWNSQTIALNSTGYNLLLICCINKYDNVDYPVPFLIGKSSVHYGMAVNNYGRGVYATDTDVTFVNANNTASDRCIPYKIYGVRVG